MPKFRLKVGNKLLFGWIKLINKNSLYSKTLFYYGKHNYSPSAMIFDPENKIVKLCAKGMEMEGQPDEAKKLFTQAWEEASNDIEKLTAAHYIARHQSSVADKLRWDEVALQYASNVKEDSVKGIFPSLYLNIAKCYEDLNDLTNAQKYYQIALVATDTLVDDGYGSMIKKGILNGIERVKMQ